MEIGNHHWRINGIVIASLFVNIRLCKNDSVCPQFGIAYKDERPDKESTASWISNQF